MRVLIASPTARPAITGNAATVERWARGLEARGHAASVVALGADARARDLVLAIERSSPDVVHLHHALRTGRFADEARARAALVVSFAGTDLARDDLGQGLEVVRRAA